MSPECHILCILIIERRNCMVYFKCLPVNIQGHSFLNLPPQNKELTSCLYILAKDLQSHLPWTGWSHSVWTVGDVRGRCNALTLNSPTPQEGCTCLPDCQSSSILSMNIYWEPGINATCFRASKTNALWKPEKQLQRLRVVTCVAAGASSWRTGVTWWHIRPSLTPKATRLWNSSTSLTRYLLQTR